MGMKWAGGLAVARRAAGALELCARAERSGGCRRPGNRDRRILARSLARGHRPITFFISLFNDTVNVYEIHNNGNWYNFGFVLGAGVSLGGGGAGSRGRRG